MGAELLEFKKCCPWAVWWPLYLFAVWDIELFFPPHTCSPSLLSWGYMAWQCGEILIPNKATPTSKEETGLKKVYLCRIQAFIQALFYSRLTNGTVKLDRRSYFDWSWFLWKLFFSVHDNCLWLHNLQFWSNVVCRHRFRNAEEVPKMLTIFGSYIFCSQIVLV